MYGRSLSNSLKTTYEGIKKQNTKYIAKMDDQSGKTRSRSIIGQRESIVGGGGDLSRSLANNYKKDDNEYFEKQRLAQLQKEQAEYLFEEQ